MKNKRTTMPLILRILCFSTVMIVAPGASAFTLPCEPVESNISTNLELQSDGSIVQNIDHDIDNSFTWQVGSESAPEYMLGRQGYWFRLGSKGPERPFSSLKYCTNKTADNHIDIYYREENEMVFVPIAWVQAKSACGSESTYGGPNSSGVICNKYPNGLSDQYAPIASGNEINDDIWHVRTFGNNYYEFSVPSVIEGVRVRALCDIATGGGETTYSYTWLGCSRGSGSGLLVPRWWVEEQNRGGGIQGNYIDFDEIDEYAKQNYQYYVKDNAGQGLQDAFLDDPRFEAKVSYHLSGDTRGSALQEEVRINTLAKWSEQWQMLMSSSNFALNMHLLKYSEGGDPLVTSYLDNIEGHQDGLAFTNLVLHNKAKLAPTTTRIGPSYGGPDLTYGLASTLFDAIPTTKDLLQSITPDGTYINAWIWLWEDIEPLAADDTGIPLIADRLVIPPLAGDYNGDNCVDRIDLTQYLLPAIRSGSTDPMFDLNGDGSVNIADARKLVVLFSNQSGLSCD
jgi:hypothetical protein